MTMEIGLPIATMLVLMVAAICLRTVMEAVTHPQAKELRTQTMTTGKTADLMDYAMRRNRDMMWYLILTLMVITTITTPTLLEQSKTIDTTKVKKQNKMAPQTSESQTLISSI